MTSIIKVDTIQTSAGGTPTASSLGISGTIGQVVTTTFTGTESATTKASDGNYTDSSVFASLTPTSSSSKIIVMCTINAGGTDGTNGSHIGRFTQKIGTGSATPVFVGDLAGNRRQNSSGRGNESQGGATILTMGFNFVLSPNTTSEVTVRYQFTTRGTNVGTAYINRGGTDGDTTEDGRTASAITLMEVLV